MYCGRYRAAKVGPPPLDVVSFSSFIHELDEWKEQEQEHQYEWEEQEKEKEQKEQEPKDD